MAKFKLSPKSVLGSLQKPALAALGVYASTKIDSLLPPVTKDAKGVVTSGMLSDPKIKAGLKIALGILLPMVAGKGKLSGPVGDLSAGIATCGFLQLANETVLSTNKVAISGNDWQTLGYIPRVSGDSNIEDENEALGRY